MSFQPTKERIAVGRVPIVKSGPFNLFRKYTWNVREWNNRLVLQANTSTEIRSDQTLADLLSRGEEPESGKQFIDISSGKRCFYRSLTDRLVSEPIDDEFFKGKSLNEYHAESLDYASDDVPLVKVAYKETDEIGKYPHPCLLVEVCDPQFHRFKNKFRTHRYLTVTARMEHAFIVRNALADSSMFCSISEHLVKPENVVVGIEFGNGVKRVVRIKIDSDISVGFIPCKNGSQRWDEMCTTLEKYIQTNSKGAIFSRLESWDPSQRVPRGQMMEHKELDLVVVEIPESGS